MLLFVLVVANVTHAAVIDTHGFGSITSSWYQSSADAAFQVPEATSSSSLYASWSNTYNTATHMQNVAYIRIHVLGSCPLSSSMQLGVFNDVGGSTSASAIAVVDEGSGYCRYDFTANTPSFNVSPYRLGYFDAYGAYETSLIYSDPGLPGTEFAANGSTHVRDVSWWYQTCDSGGCGSTPPPPNASTRIISTTPVDNEATTSPVALSMQYYVDASSSVDTTEVSLYRLESGNALAFHATGTAATGTITTWSASSSASLPDGLYSAFWSLTSSQSLLFNISTSTTFIVGTSTWAQLINLGSSTASTVAATSSCSIIDVGCNIIAALTWAFAPSQVSLQLLAQASNALYTAPPVGYLKAYQDTVRIAFSTTTPDSVGFSGDAIDVIGAVYGTSSVRTGLVAGYWAAFAIFFYSGTISLIHAVL